MTDQKNACPKCGDEVVVLDSLGYQPKCQACKMVATAWNSKTGEVTEWATVEGYRSALEEMNRQMDDAFDNTYFSGGW